jgi:hypothetical protein
MFDLTIAPYFPFRRIKIINQSVDIDASKASIEILPHKLFKRLAAAGDSAGRGGSIRTGDGLVRPANLIIPPFMRPFFTGAVPIKRMRSRG